MLQGLEKVRHNERVLVLVQAGKKGEPFPAPANHYERTLRVYHLYGSLNKEAIEAAAKEERAEDILSLLFPLVARCASDDFVLSSLTGPWAVHPNLGGLMASLKVHGRVALIDLFLMRCPAHQQRFIHHASAEFVAANSVAVNRWRDFVVYMRLAKRFPRLVLDMLEKRLAVVSKPTDDPLLLSNLAIVLNTIRTRWTAFEDESFVLAQQILTVFGIDGHDGRGVLAALFAMSPVRAADLVLHSFAGANVTDCMQNVAWINMWVLGRADVQRLIALVKCRAASFSQKWFRHLEPFALRETVYRACFKKDFVLRTELIAALPGAELRAQEARKGLEGVNLHYIKICALAAFLPVDEAAAILKPYIVNKDANTRANGVSATVAHHMFGDAAAALEIVVVQRKNEQEPVRAVLVTELSRFPPSRFIPHLALVEQLVQLNLDAIDTSHHLFSLLQTLLIRIFDASRGEAEALRKPMFALARRTLSFPLPYAATMSSAVVAKLDLMPLLQEWKAAKKIDPIVVLVQCVGRRLFLAVSKDFPSLLVSLLDGATDVKAAAIVGAIEQVHPETLRTLAPRLLAEDSSWIKHLENWVLRYGNATPWLTCPDLQGRFGNDETYFFPRASSHWTHAQQQLLADSLARVFSKTELDYYSKMRALDLLPQLRSIEPTLLISLMRIQEGQNVAIRDRAVRAAGRLVGGRGVPLLLECLGDERARQAVYAMLSSFKRMGTSATLSILRSIPLTKVSIAKEVVRIMAALPDAAGLPDMLEMARREPALHHDVLASIVSCIVREHLSGNEAAWSVVETLSKSSQSSIVCSCLAVNVTKLSPAEQVRAVRTLIVPASSHSEHLVRDIALRKLIEAARNNDPDGIVAPLLTRVALTAVRWEEREIAVVGLFSLYCDDASKIVHLLDQMEGPAQREALSRVLDRFAQYADQKRMKSVVTAVLGWLAKNPIFALFRVKVCLFAGRFDLFESVFAQACACNPEALMQGLEVIKSRGRYIPAEVENQFRSHSDERFRRVSLAMLCAVATHQAAGWSEELRAVLEQHRNDSSIMVAAAAQFTFPPVL